MRDYEDNEVLPSLPPSWPSFLSVPQSLDFSAPGNALWQSSSVWGFPFANALPLQSFVCIAQVPHEATTKRPKLTTMPMQNNSPPHPFLLLQWSSFSFTWKILLIYKYYISLHRVESILHIKKFLFRNTYIQIFLFIISVGWHLPSRSSLDSASSRICQNSMTLCWWHIWRIKKTHSMQKSI